MFKDDTKEEGHEIIRIIKVSHGFYVDHIDLELPVVAALKVWFDDYLDREARGVVCQGRAGTS